MRAQKTSKSALWRSLEPGPERKKKNQKRKGGRFSQWLRRDGKVVPAPGEEVQERRGGGETMSQEESGIIPGEGGSGGCAG